MDISIIIPHKNSIETLKRLLKSIRLFHGEIQVIVVDDNSKNDVIKELKELSLNYKFELYSNEGYGAGGARNTGLQKACGNWIMFADSDDFFIDGWELEVKKYIQSSYDIIFFNVNSCYSNSLKKAYRDEHIKHIVNQFIRSKDLNYLRFGYLTPWGKLIKRKLIVDNNISFEEICAGNDMMFSLKTGFSANSVKLDSSEIYMVTASSGSITTTLSLERFDSRFKATIRANNFLRSNNLYKYQLSILYFLAKSTQFGCKYFISVLLYCIKNKCNPFIGVEKIFHYKKVLQDRQNKELTLMEHNKNQ